MAILHLSRSSSTNLQGAVTDPGHLSMVVFFSSGIPVGIGPPAEGGSDAVQSATET